MTTAIPKPDRPVGIGAFVSQVFAVCASTVKPFRIRGATRQIKSKAAREALLMLPRSLVTVEGVLL